MADRQSKSRISVRDLTPKNARRLADIADALERDLGPVELLDARDWMVTPRCENCACEMEGGHCYCCFPVWGYGDPWQAERHPGWNPNMGPWKP